MSSVATRTVCILMRIHDSLSRFSFAIGVTALGLIVVIFSYEVMMRYFFLAPVRWANDYVTFLLLIKVFCVLPMLTREAQHIAITLIPDMLSEHNSDLIKRVGFIVAATACLWTGYISLQELIYLAERGTMTLTTIRVPKWILIGFITYGITSAGLYFLRLGILGQDITESEKNDA